MIKKKNKLLLAVILGTLVLPTTMVQAGLQANPNTHYKKADIATNWMTNIRNTETTGGAMGLNETINGTTKVATSESNNIDVHMAKSTEYGAVLILSASGYGNPQILQNSTIKTTTGNKSGIYFSGTNYEWVAGGVSGNIFPGVDGRYYDTYTPSNNASARVGDGLGNASTPNKGTAGWHSAGNSAWVNGNYYYFGRGHDGLFSFNHPDDRGGYASRGVASVALGL